MTTSARGWGGAGGASRHAEQVVGGHAPTAALFAGTGEVRALARTLDWGATPLGSPDTWSPALRIATRAMLEAPHPICLWCGATYALVYNDAYRRILGAKHPAALGQPGWTVWAEIWDELAPQFAQVSAGGPPVTGENAHFAVARGEGGGTEDAWFSYALSALRDEDGTIVAVLNISPENTGQVRVERALALERTRLAAVFEQSPSFLAVLRGKENVFEFVNAAYQQIVGRGRALLGRPLFDAIPETQGQGFDAYLGHVRDTGEPLVFRDLPVLLDRTPGAPREERLIDITYLPLSETDGSGAVTHDAVIAHGTDVTEQVRARRQIEGLLAASERARAEAEAARAESQDANAQLQDQQLELELANQQLQDQATELESQAEALQATAAELEERTREAEVARQDAEAERARAEGILEGMADAYFALDPDFRLVAVNAAMERGSGLPRAALLGGDYWALFPGAIGTDFERYYRQVAAERVEAHFTHDYSDGRLALVVEVDAYPAAGGGVAVFWRDVTLRVRAEVTLRASEQRLRDVFEQAPVAVAVLTGPEHIYTVMSPRYAELLPARVAGLGRPFREVVPEIAGQGLVELMDHVYQTGEPFSASERLVRLDRDGDGVLEDYYFDVGYQPLRDPTGAVYAVASVSREVTAAVAAQRDVEAARAEAERARAAAEQANRAKTEFLSTMSHELRTPLNAIGGYAELLALGIRGPVTDAQRQDLDRLRRANQHMAGLVDAVLNFTRLTAGQVEYHLEAVRLGPLVQDLDALVGPQLAAKGLTYDHAGCGPATPERPHVVWADPEKVRQILLNLLTNAVKFTDAGGRVTLACETDAAVGVIRVRVSDTGRGIAAEQLERVFEPFVQVDRQRTQASQQGVGLGLAISRDLARGMGGGVTAESTPGVGSTFTLTLPAAS